MTDLSHELGPVSEAEVRESVRITRLDIDEVRRIRLRIDDPAFRFSVGQSIGVVVPGPHPFGNPYHMRRYSIAGGLADPDGDAMEIELLVRRCFYVDEVSGESYPGIASNYLCDAAVGSRVTLTGPYRSPFRMPVDDRANIVMIGAGTGVAPFRSFVQEIYGKRGGWRGQVRLYYGARNGMDLLYGNDAQDDLPQYYDEASFRAFGGVLGKPLASEADTLEAAVSAHADDVWELLQDPSTHVYLAGLGKVAERLDEVMERAANSASAWKETKEWLRSQGRWFELIYS